MTDGTQPPRTPQNLASLPLDPESLAQTLADEPATFSYWQAQAEEYRHILDGLKSKRDFLINSEYLNARGTVAEREATSKSHPDVLDAIEQIETVEHNYRQCLNNMTSSDIRMTAVKKILSWRMEEARSIALGEQSTSGVQRVRGTNINLERS